MKTAAFAMTLLVGAAALAPVPAAAMPYAGDGAATAAWETEGSAVQDPTAQDATVVTVTPVAAADAVVQPSNANPERDARGIAVISAPAIVPAGWNGLAGTGEAMGGPLLDPATGAPVADTASSRPCTRTVTDHCVQTYERHRAR